MPTWLHATLMLIICFAGAIAGDALAHVVYSHFQPPIVLANVLLTVFVILGLIGPASAFVRIVPVRCKQCGAASWGGTIGGAYRYKCSTCGVVVQTPIEGD